MADSDTAKLCWLCEKINFAAILTPREVNNATGLLNACLNPEYTGSGASPYSLQPKPHRSEWTGPPEEYLPKIRTADYDNLSDDETGEPKAQAGGGEISAASATLSSLKLNNDEGKKDDEDGYESDSSRESNESHFLENTPVDLDKQEKGDLGYRHGMHYYLGTIWDVRSRRLKCDFCKELWGYMRRNSQIIGNFLTKSSCMLKMVELKGKRSDGSNKEVILINLVFIYAFKLGDPKQSNWVIRMSTIIQGAHKQFWHLHSAKPPFPLVPFQDRLYGQARPTANTCNFQLFQEWLKRCETKHQHIQPQWGPPQNMPLRLIDVQQQCLIDWNGLDSEVPRYVALSYVWGRPRQKVLLTKRLLDNFKQPGGLNVSKDDTIEDAFKVVANIGERYLWIDAICILQDDGEDKNFQVSQMHKIYGKSVLTLVAAYGPDVRSGLRGVRPKSRSTGKSSIKLKDIQLYLRGTHKIDGSRSFGNPVFTENYLRDTPYKSRGWTFQEAYLSPRLLIFTKDSVYWECDQCTWNEETYFESDTIDFVGWRALKNPMADDVWYDKLERDAYDILTEEEMEREPPRTTYAAIVKEYTSRNLSSSQDIHYACQGVLAAIKGREQTNFVHALRGRYFGNDLLFNMTVARKRRFPNFSSVHTGFPTWSWLAWAGRINIANEPRNNSHDLVENLVPCDGVKCYTVIVQKGKRSLKVINETGGWQFRADYVRTGEGIFDLAALRSGRLDLGMDSELSDESLSNKLPKKQPVDIREYRQELTMEDLQSHPAIRDLKPRFHIMFRTFSSIVVLRTEFDRWSAAMADQGSMMGGTKMTRGDGVWDNMEKIQRNLYVLKEKTGQGEVEEHDHEFDDDDDCPTCGNHNPAVPTPEGFNIGPFVGRLPVLSKCWDGREYVYQAVPDGVYVLLYMNNNQLPMFGHFLCKPVSSTASKDGRWDGEILQRVSGVVGPTDILDTRAQHRFGAKWGTIILA